MAKNKHLQKQALLRVMTFGCITILLGVISVFALVRNSQGAKDRYEALIAVDQAGGDVEVALDELRQYVFAHMNTQIGGENGIKPPIQLKGTYDRLVAASQAQSGEASSALYGQAQVECERTLPTGFSGSNRLDCITAYVDANGGQSTQIEDSLYKFDFVPPRWSPDIAGFSLLFLFLFGAIFLIDLGLYFRTRSMVRIAN